MNATNPADEQGRAPPLYDEQLQRKQHEKKLDPRKADDEAKAAEAEAS